MIKDPKDDFRSVLFSAHFPFLPMGLAHNSFWFPAGITISGSNLRLNHWSGVDVDVEKSELRMSEIRVSAELCMRHET